MELENMRDRLAEVAMGWHRQEPCRKWPVEDDVYLDESRKWGPRSMFCDDWKPDLKWEHNGWLIDVMIAKGWSFQGRQDDHAAWAVFWRDDTGQDGHGHANASSGGVRGAVCRAVVRALGCSEWTRSGGSYYLSPPPTMLLGPTNE